MDVQPAVLRAQRLPAKLAMPTSSFKLVPAPPVLLVRPQLEERRLLVLLAQRDVQLVVLQVQQLPARHAVSTLDLPLELALLVLLELPHQEESLSALPVEMAALLAQRLEPT